MILLYVRTCARIHLPPFLKEDTPCRFKRLRRYSAVILKVWRIPPSRISNPYFWSKRIFRRGMIFCLTNFRSPLRAHPGQESFKITFSFLENGHLDVLPPLNFSFLAPPSVAFGAGSDERSILKWLFPPPTDADLRIWPDPNLLLQWDIRTNRPLGLYVA